MSNTKRSVGNEAKSPRNRTLSLEADEEAALFSECLNLLGKDSVPPLSLADSCGRTICADTFAALPALVRGCARLAVIDPPYNLRKNYGGTTFSRTDAKSYAGFTRRYLSLVLPVLTEDASLYLCSDWRTSITVASVLSELEEQKRLVIRNRITWQREKGRGSRSNWKNSMEDIWFCTKGSGWQFNVDAVKLRRKVLAPYREDGKPKDWSETGDGKFRDTCPSNFWDDISVPFWSMAENTAHPAQKSEKLLAKLILASSSPGDIVLDPFAGSGTTQVVARKTGRRFIAIEQNPGYCALAQKRLHEADRDGRIQGYADGVFWERNTVPPSGKRQDGRCADGRTRI